MIISRCIPNWELIKAALEIYSQWVEEEVHLLDCLVLGKGEMAHEFASIRLLDQKGRLNHRPFEAELEFERQRLKHCLCGKGNVYDGISYSLLCRQLISGHLHEELIIIIPDYIATRGDDGLWHLRYAVFGDVVLISLSGIKEAPARERDYYVAQALRLRVTEPPSLAPSMARILAGILLQARFFFWTGYPFCKDPYCSLYNAHWQRELFQSQRDEPYVLCHDHSVYLKDMKDSYCGRPRNGKR